MVRNDSKLPPNRKQGDLNMQRYVYVMACLVGQTVTVHMKDQTQVRGIFHSGQFSSPNGSSNSDVSIVLKCARVLPVEDKLSGEIVDTLIIQGKDMISLSADDCPTDFDETEIQAKRRSGFKTDVEISGNAVKGEVRELEKWEPEVAEATTGMALTTLEDRAAPGWDQFEVNARRFQVKSTYQEELYTTPLDMTSIPPSVREKADQIAREIEAAQYGTIDPEKIGEGDLDDDEEARFGAVRGTGAYRFATGQPQRHQTAAQKGSNFQPSSPFMQAAATTSQSATNTPYKRPLTGGVSTVAGAVAGAPTTTTTATNATSTSGKTNTDSSSITATQKSTSSAQVPSHRAITLVPKVGRVGITAKAVGLHAGALSSLHGQMRNASLVKNINALNLEPALPKLDDQGRIDLFTKPGGGRNGPSRSPVPTPVDRSLEKQNFLASLNQIKEKMEKIKWSERTVKPGTSIMTAMKTSSSKKAAAIAGLSSKNFRFNPNADAFTPSGRGSTSFNCSQCAANENTNPAKCTHKNEETGDEKDDKECQRDRPSFKSLTSTPKFREPMDRFLMSRLLPLLATEVPSSVHPIWNLDIPSEKRRPFTYNQILGDLHPSPSAAAAVNAAVGSAWQETKLSRPQNTTADEASRQSIEGLNNDQQRATSNQPRQPQPAGKLGGAGSLRPRTGPSSTATTTPTAATSTASSGGPSRPGHLSSNRQHGSGSGNLGGGGGGHNQPQQQQSGGMRQAEESSTTSAATGTSPLLVSNPPPGSAPAVQQLPPQPHPLMMAGPQSGWRVTNTPSHPPHMMDPNAPANTAAGMYSGQQIQVQQPGGQYQTATHAYHPGQQQPPNGNYIVVSRNPMVPQGATGMVAFVNEDGTLQHASMQAPQSMQPQHQVVVPMDPNGVPTASIMNGGEQGNMISAAFPGAQFMGMPGSNVVFIPPGAFITSAPGSETPMKLENQGGQQHVRQVVGGHVPVDNMQQQVASQPRWIQTGVDANGAPIMQQERVMTPSSPAGPHHQMPPNITTAAPQYNHYQMFQHPQQFAAAAAGPGGGQPQFIGFPQGYFPAAPYGGYIAPNGQFQPQMPPPQAMNYQTSQMGAPMMMMMNNDPQQQSQHMMDGTQQQNNHMQQQQSNPRQTPQQMPRGMPQGRDPTPGNGPPQHPQSPGPMQRQMSMKHGKKN